MDFGIRTFQSCESAKFQLGLKFDKKLKQIDRLILSLVRDNQEHDPCYVYFYFGFNMGQRKSRDLWRSKIG